MNIRLGSAVDAINNGVSESVTSSADAIVAVAIAPNATITVRNLPVFMMTTPLPSDLACIEDFNHALPPTGGAFGPHNNAESMGIGTSTIMLVTANIAVG